MIAKLKREKIMNAETDTLKGFRNYDTILLLVEKSAKKCNKVYMLKFCIIKGKSLIKR